ncbi:MAG: putative two-component sensor histidine kinase protein [Cypionkella sp.]|uniref:sensor histidine kinase n=1 Tax=Cypionkella sp. TaxID=2811411 RepID=UPI002614E237|nr:sensor histidine kinase [Cypionkella sp.]MDB5659709.1 putative two-component sensor histidine kinase protein [Cypionkella sp.]
MNANDGELGSAGQAFDAFIEELLTARKARQQAESQRQVLLAEMDHRGKNLLAMIQAIARRTFSRTEGEPEMRVFSGRLQAIGEANSMLRRENWQSAALEDLAKGAITPFVHPSSHRVSLSGPNLSLQSDVVLPFSMAVHELCTNAVKYGALSNETGTISMEWQIVPSPAGENLLITWQERGGPTVAIPQKRGFGSSVIEQILSSNIGGKAELVYDPQGLVCRMTLPAKKALTSKAKDEERVSVDV